MGRATRAFSRRFEKKRVHEILNKESFELLGFSKKFHDENMNPIHRRIVLALFRFGFQKLSKFVQSFAGFTIVHVSKVPPKIDIYSMGTYVGIVGYFYWTGNLFLAQILSLGRDPLKLIEMSKVLVASNYRESQCE
ncbi:hypothetical protein LEP1GSC084_1045 [Leptospira interrogans serovar Medanensis str. L0448]|uniref:hypothetical protein n=1 Tax=Leptospira interrogans TaxID=173 RepID=UPI000297337F|nr:hypothetical protein [Leptospira interrogans]EKR82594.1 hypothetical protein LEP1GSC099_1417 [Leptospira interrogans str. UI 08452]EMJ56519.1 hypothetical protein LEP1GSC111_1241 [Leptospira interrogans str. UT126]EMN33156.1 hypothetical protein LEP1GSC084_1045 [Leptospira interrogans serovar Medanensis str. L0448]